LTKLDKTRKLNWFPVTASSLRQSYRCHKHYQVHSAVERPW